MNTTRHLTTRRGFVATLGFGGVSLYGLWAAYGAAPGPIALLQGAAGGTADAADADWAMNGMAMHGGTDAGPDIKAFRTEVSAFVERFSQGDGSVYPRLAEARGASHDPQMPGTGMAGMDMSGMAMPGMTMAPGSDHQGTAADHGAAPAAGEGASVDIPMLAERWFFEPAHLRLDRGTPYRFRMMTADVAHGASIQFGPGARMIRLSPGAVTELALTFTRPGSFLVYCTAYCGAGHDGMQARVDIV